MYHELLSGEGQILWIYEFHPKAGAGVRPALL